MIFLNKRYRPLTVLIRYYIHNGWGMRHPTLGTESVPMTCRLFNDTTVLPLWTIFSQDIPRPLSTNTLLQSDGAEPMFGGILQRPLSVTGDSQRPTHTVVLPGPLGHSVSATPGRFGARGRLGRLWGGSASVLRKRTLQRARGRWPFWSHGCRLRTFPSLNKSVSSVYST